MRRYTLFGIVPGHSAYVNTPIEAYTILLSDDDHDLLSRSIVRRNEQATIRDVVWRLEPADELDGMGCALSVVMMNRRPSGEETADYAPGCQVHPRAVTEAMRSGGAISPRSFLLAGEGLDHFPPVD